MDPDLVSLQSRVRSLERKLRRTHALGALLVAGALAVGFTRQSGAAASAAKGASGDGVLRARALVIEDEQGRPRVLLGAPVADVKGRRRTDAATGLVLLDESGRDRLQVGNCGGPQMGGVVQGRIAPTTGIMLCDLKGDERGGYGFLDNGRIVLGMDEENGEGVVLFVAPDLGSKGLIVNEYRGQKNATRLFLGLGKQGDATLELKDGKGMGRLRAVATPEETPQLLLLDAEGQELSDVLEK
jgi:hypothetical protein